MSGAKLKLTIRKWSTQTGADQPGTAFSAMINPAKYSRTYAVPYVQKRNGDKNKESTDHFPGDKLDFDEIVLDGTGIVDAPDSARDVDGQIALLRRVLEGRGNDNMVRHAVVDIVWGPMSFTGRLTSMTVSYTLFSASGAPLRARVKLSFTAFQNKTEQAADDAEQAHQIRLVGGDNLPLLCFKAYNDPSLFQAVALFNKLTTIRRLNPGEKLILPKMR